MNRSKNIEIVPDNKDETNKKFKLECIKLVNLPTKDFKAALADAKVLYSWLDEK